MQQTLNPRTRAKPAVELIEPGWTRDVRRELGRLIRAGAGQGLPVAFDFDNTIVCGDIGEATLAVLAREGRLSPARQAAAVSPSFRNAKGEMVSPASALDLTAYYEDYLAPTRHGSKDSTPLANGYVWAAEVMAGLSPLEVVRATRLAYEQSRPGQEVRLDVTPGRTSYPAPFFYAETVELIAELLRNQFAVWIVSASNVWSVRWMVQHGLNPLLRQRGASPGLPPARVIGIATLLADAQGYLCKDAVLVKDDPRYAALDEARLGSLTLTSQLQFPAPTYSGKVACLWDCLAGQPYLAAGDSPGDLPMLTFSRHRLWIARLEKPDYQRAVREAMSRAGPRGWLLQPALCRRAPGFLPDFRAVAGALGEVPAKVGESLDALRS